MAPYLKISLVLTLLSLCIHTYLTLHYYDINFDGDLGQSKCNINTTFNCDTVALSPFAALLGIPLSLWGGLTHMVLVLLLCSLLSGFSSHPQYTKKYSLWLGGFITLVSILMFVISMTQLSSYCIYCMAAYALSFITLFTLWKAQSREEKAFTIWEGTRGLLTHSKSLLIMLLAVPVMSFFLHHRLLERTLESHGYSNSKKWDLMIERAISSWSANPQFKFSSLPSLTKGPPADKAVMTVVEFADFLCIHCKKAASGLKTFAALYPDVRFEFYNFPLDGACNKEIQRSRNINCRMAKAVHCSGKQSNKWTLHDVMFENQDKFQKVSNISDADNFIKIYTEASKLNWDELKSCMESPEAQDTLLAQTQSAETAKIKATPTIYVEGRHLPQGHVIPILSKVYKKMR